MKWAAENSRSRQLLWLMCPARDINNPGLMYRRRWLIAKENVADRWHKGMSHFERCRYLNAARFLIMWFMAVIADSPALSIRTSALPPVPSPHYHAIYMTCWETPRLFNQLVFYALILSFSANEQKKNPREWARHLLETLVRKVASV